MFLDYCRNSLGSNDNPNASEFKSAYRKLLICHPSLTSVDHNVITNATGILTVSSDIKTKPLPPSTTGQEFELNTDLDYEVIMLREIDEMDKYAEHLCAYVASCIEEKFNQNVRQYKYKCSLCVKVLQTDNKINDELLEMKSENKQPSVSTLKLAIFSDAIMKTYSLEQRQGNSFDSIKKSIQNNIDITDIYTNFAVVHGPEMEQNHKVEFISELIKIYMSLKSKRIGGKITNAEQGELIRRKRKRAVILAGQ